MNYCILFAVKSLCQLDKARGCININISQHITSHKHTYMHTYSTYIQTYIHIHVCMFAINKYLITCNTSTYVCEKTCVCVCTRTNKPIYISSIIYFVKYTQSPNINIYFHNICLNSKKITQHHAISG